MEFDGICRGNSCPPGFQEVPWRFLSLTIAGDWSAVGDSIAALELGTQSAQVFAIRAR